ncbi:Protein of unknown function, partial [Cotesia congregata]
MLSTTKETLFFQGLEILISKQWRKNLNKCNFLTTTAEPCQPAANDPAIIPDVPNPKSGNALAPAIQP